MDTTEAFLRCKAAYEVLSNEQRRSEYDQQLDAAADTWQVGLGCWCMHAVAATVTRHA